MVLAAKKCFKLDAELIRELDRAMYKTMDTYDENEAEKAYQNYLRLKERSNKGDVDDVYIDVMEEQWNNFEKAALEAGWEKWVSANGLCSVWFSELGKSIVGQEYYLNENSNVIIGMVIKEEFLTMCNN